ncbi:MAG TPA: NAD-dependent succinate-semialdehyde dehydrogenase [Labilithrix sp.]|nr:NAD-dependent succinate-semialdehyde dehydrogenase [Labilithrix sp.]
MQSLNLIGASWVKAQDGREFPVQNPATDEVIAKVPLSGKVETRAAIQAAADALPAWRARSAIERAKPLRKLADLMLAKTEELARLMTLEQGKPLAESRGEIAYAASFLEWAAEEAKRVYGETVPASDPKKRILVLRQPVGVTACITPWNFPAAMITRKLGPALAAGCTMVVKPAELTPLSALALAELALEAGIPPGVMNVVTGEPQAIGAELLSNPLVRKLSFTGSTPVGKKLMVQAAENVTRLSLELGGHAPFIVFDDADVDAAVAGALGNKYRNMGQTCICANRFFVQSGIYEAFASKLQAAVEKMKIGPGLEEGVSVGPLINDAAVEKVRAHVDDALSKGAKLRTGGKLASLGAGYTNRFYAPTILDGFTDDMKINREEGPRVVG